MSLINQPKIWKEGPDCLFFDTDEATQEQLSFISRVKNHFDWAVPNREEFQEGDQNPYEFRTEKSITSAYEKDFVIPAKYAHVDLEKLHTAGTDVESLKILLTKIHPWSSLHFGLSAIDIATRLYLEWIPKYRGKETEIQILTPMTRGTLGTVNLNRIIQEKVNPPGTGKRQLKVGDRIFREDDRVIHRRNNYDLNVFNGDIGRIIQIDNENLGCIVSFYPDERKVQYKKEDIMELDLAYAITIHKAQGSEFSAVIIPILTQHYKMLFRKLIYTGLTRAKDFAAIVGTRRAFSMAIKQKSTEERQTALEKLLRKSCL